MKWTMNVQRVSTIVRLQHMVRVKNWIKSHRAKSLTLNKHLKVYMMPNNILLIGHSKWTRKFVHTFHLNKCFELRDQSHVYIFETDKTIISPLQRTLSLWTSPTKALSWFRSLLRTFPGNTARSANQNIEQEKKQWNMGTYETDWPKYASTPQYAYSVCILRGEYRYCILHKYQLIHVPVYMFNL